MQKRIRAVLLGVAALFAVVTASYVFAVIRTDTPEQLVAELQQAANDGDADLFLSYLTEESRKSVEASYADRRVREAHAEFEKALDEKFGKGAGWVADAEVDTDLKSAITRISKIELVSTREVADGSVELQIRTTAKTENDNTETIDQTVGATRVNEEWKLSLGYPEDNPAAERIKSEIARVAGEVRAGKFADRVTAMIALYNALRQMEVKR